jgi:uncharacterized membrane protein YccF (DUF307 family)
MSTVGNIFWIIFGGFFIFLEYIFAGVLLCLTIIGIPFGLQSFKIGVASLVPFGKKVVDKHGTSSSLSLLFNIIWILIGGIWIALSPARASVSSNAGAKFSTRANYLMASCHSKIIIVT